jgi:hypothetical protein
MRLRNKRDAAQVQRDNYKRQYNEAEAKLSFALRAQSHQATAQTPLTEWGERTRATHLFPNMSAELAAELFRAKSDNEIWNELGEIERRSYEDE